MSRGTILTTPVEQIANQTLRYGVSRPYRVLALALAGTLAISAALVIPGWIPVLPRPIRRGLTEVALANGFGRLQCARFRGAPGNGDPRRAVVAVIPR